MPRGKIRTNLNKALNQVKTEEQAKAAVKLQQLKKERDTLKSLSDAEYNELVKANAQEQLDRAAKGEIKLTPQERTILKSRAKRGESWINTGPMASRKAEERKAEDRVDEARREAEGQRSKYLSRQIYNVQRRYKRAAERSEKAAFQAAKAGDYKEALQLEAAAKAARIIAGGIGEERRNITKLFMSAEERNKEREKLLKRTEEQSRSMLATYQTRQKDRGRKATARTVLKAGSEATFYAATKALWQGKEYADRDKAIVEGFQRMGYEVDDILDVMTVLQQEGVDILNLESNDRNDYILRTRTGANLVARKLNEAGL